MSLPIESYALIGDLHGAALVSNEGSIDWLVVPRFDSGSCFSALLGERKDGTWRIAPTEAAARVTRRYRSETLILETTFTGERGKVRVNDAMIVGGECLHHVVRIVEGLEGEMEFETVFLPRFDYGSAMPWLRYQDPELIAICGPDGLILRAPVALERCERSYVARFSVRAGESLPFALTWFPSNLQPPHAIDASVELERTERWWKEWSANCTYAGPYRDEVMRSLIVLKALSYEPTGAIVAAPTTSLPEALGGVRNWDYRYCWLRDATFTILALLNAGYREETVAFVEWLTRAIAGDPADLQIMYGVDGERRLHEYTLPWLRGYENSRPVRTGNAAYAQFQLDVYGEVVDALYQALKVGIPVHEAYWEMLSDIVTFVAARWKNSPDKGMWEMRGKPRHFVESKVMAWVVFDRIVKLAEMEQVRGPVDEWRSVRDEIHADILAKGFDAQRNTFVQSYGSQELDANLLLIAQVGFLPPDDPRILGTVAAIERELYNEPFVCRYSGSKGPLDGLPQGEGAFFACSFWLCDMYVLQGRIDDARALFERLLQFRNDVGLLSEEYDADVKRMVGNFPQAFSHLALVNTAYRLEKWGLAREQRLL